MKLIGIGFGNLVSAERTISIVSPESAPIKRMIQDAREKGLRYRGLPAGADDSFFLCRELIPGYLDGITGEYGPPRGYFVDEKRCEEFDRQFPPKVKRKLPGQLV